MSIRIAHLSDTHLGYSDLDRVGPDGVNLREADFYRSFTAAVDRILDLRPDAVVHAGDFFHRPSPANRPLVQGLGQLKRLSDAKIPVVIIAGNHSTPRTIYTSPILEALRSVSRVYPVFEQKYEAVEVNGAMFHGLPHVNDDGAFAREIESIEPVSGKVNVLILHTSIGKDFIMDEYGERIFPGERIAMLKEFHYTAAGHWHNFQEIAGLKNAVYSGSTERLSDREAGREKGFVIADIDAGGGVTVQFTPVPARPWHRFDVKECAKKSVADIKKEIGEFSEQAVGEGALVSVYLHNISPTQSVDVPNAWVAEQFPGALSVMPKRTFFRKQGGASAADFRGESLDELFDAYLKDEAEDEKEYGRMMELARKYFHRYESGE